MQSNNCFGFCAGLNDWIPVAGKQRRETDVLGPLGKSDGDETASRIAPNLGGTFFRIGEKCKAKRNDSVRCRLPPLFI